MEENTTVSLVAEKEKKAKKASDKANEVAKETMNIFQKMLAITAELQTVAKNMEVGTGNNKYKAVSERDILDAVKPTEEKYGVYSYPYSREVLESNLLESENVYNGQTTKKTTFMTRIMTVYRFVNVDNPTEYIETTTFSEGIDAQDKGSGKAMTYGDKYALMKAYKISTGDDPDATASEDSNYTATKSTTPPKGAWGSKKAEDTTKENTSAKTETASKATATPTKDTAQKNAPAPTGKWGSNKANASANANTGTGANTSAPTGRWGNRVAQ